MGAVLKLCAQEKELNNQEREINNHNHKNIFRKKYPTLDPKIMEGPQMDVPVGNGGQGPTSGGWQGMSIKDILERVDLFNFTTLVEDEDKKKETTPPKESPLIPDLKLIKAEPSMSTMKSAFLGPKIWKNPLSFHKLAGAGSGNNESMEATGAEFSVMNIDDFLSENNFDFGRISPPIEDDERGGKREGAPLANMDSYRSPCSVNSDDAMMDTEQPIASPMDPHSPPRNKDLVLKRKMRGGSPTPSDPSQWNKAKNELPKGENQFLYVESKRARLEREKEERKRREQEVQVEFTAEELALATIPGADFDPARRQFSMDELKPQPIIRKRRKSYVDQERKDDKYWEKRGKNNVAARRSREARRLKENQISLRTAFLEQQNTSLKEALQKLNERTEKLSLEKKILMDKLKRYESMSPFLVDENSSSDM